MSKLLRKKQSNQSIKKRKSTRPKNQKKQKRKTRKTRKTNNFKGGSECNIVGFIKEVDIPKIISKQPKCQICNIQFNNPSYPPIYRTECCHVFHFNCLQNYCQDGITRNDQNNIFFPNCPVCNADISNDCMSTEAFKENFLDTDNFDSYLYNIYESQERMT